VIKKGATSQSVYFEVLDSSSSTGARKTGLVYNTASLVAYYVRNQGSVVAISLATLAAANSAWSSGGFKEVDATNMPGLYRLDVPDAAFASGADSVVVTIQGASNMVQASYDIQLVAWDPQDGVRGGLTALPNAAAGANGGLPLSVDSAGRVDVLKINGTSQTARDIGASVLLSPGTGTGQISLSSGQVTVGTLAANVITASSIAADAITAAKIATDAIDADALAADAVTEIWAKAMSDISAVPGMTASVLDAVNWLFALARNKRTQTSTTETVFKDDGSTSLATSAKSDDGTTFTRGEYA
jgi:hypothetical protein